MHIRQHVQNANAFEANAHKEKASMSDTQSFGLYETTCANAFEENVRMYGTKYLDAFKTTCANTLEENTNKENASMCDTQSLDVYDMCKCTYAMKTHKENASMCDTQSRGWQPAFLMVGLLLSVPTTLPRLDISFIKVPNKQQFANKT